MLSSINSRLDMYWSNQDIIYDVHAEIQGTWSRSEVTVLTSSQIQLNVEQEAVDSGLTVAYGIITDWTTATLYCSTVSADTVCPTRF